MVSNPAKVKFFLLNIGITVKVFDCWLLAIQVAVGNSGGKFALERKSQILQKINDPLKRLSCTSTDRFNVIHTLQNDSQSLCQRMALQH